MSSRENTPINQRMAEYCASPEGQARMNAIHPGRSKLVDMLAKKYLAELDPNRREVLFEQLTQAGRLDQKKHDAMAFFATLAILFGPPVLIMIAYVILN